MTEVLYANFLEDKRVYNLARASWKRLFDKLAKEHGLSYVPYINQLQGGKLEYDGNPIFSAHVSKLNRAVRIIQVEAEDDELEISAWVDSIELQEGKPAVEELVLDMVLSRRAKETATMLLEGWFVKKFSGEEVAHLIDR